MNQNEANSITTAQIKKIWVEIKKLGFEKDFLYGCIDEFYQKEHLKELTKVEAAKLIDLLVGSTKGYQLDNAKGMMTKAQGWKIEDYRIKLGWSTKALESFIKKYAHVDHVNWLTLGKASSIIEGLKNIHVRQNETAQKHKTQGGK